MLYVVFYKKCISSFNEINGKKKIYYILFFSIPCTPAGGIRVKVSKICYMNLSYQIFCTVRYNPTEDLQRTFIFTVRYLGHDPHPVLLLVNKRRQQNLPNISCGNVAKSCLQKICQTVKNSVALQCQLTHTKSLKYLPAQWVRLEKTHIFWAILNKHGAYAKKLIDRYLKGYRVLSCLGKCCSLHR